MLNTTNGTWVDASWKEPFALRVARLVVFSCIVISSLFGNGLIVKTVLSLPRRRTPFTYNLVMNLALAELLNTVLLPFLISYDEMQTWVFGQFFCQLISPLQSVAGTVITSSVAAIAACRCCVLFFPRKAANKFQRYRYGMSLVALLWLIAMALHFPNFLFNQKVESPFYKEMYWCICLLPGDSMRTFPSASFQALILVQIAISFFLNSTITVTSYGLVIYKIQNSRVYLNNNENDYDQNETVCTVELPTQTRETQTIEEQKTERTKTDKENGDKGTIQSMENDVFKMFYVIVLVFILCYFPYQIVFLMEYFHVITWQWRYLIVVRKLLLVLICLPSALHPLCYGLMTNFYAKAFKKIILCQWLLYSKKPLICVTV